LEEKKIGRSERLPALRRRAKAVLLAAGTIAKAPAPALAGSDSSAAAHLVSP